MYLCVAIANFERINPFAPNALILYTLKVFWCFQGIEKRCIGKEWFKHSELVLLLLFILFQYLQILRLTLGFRKKVTTIEIWWTEWYSSEIRDRKVSTTP